MVPFKTQSRRDGIADAGMAQAGMSVVPCASEQLRTPFGYCVSAEQVLGIRDMAR